MYDEEQRGANKVDIPGNSRICGPGNHSEYHRADPDRYQDQLAIYLGPGIEDFQMVELQLMSFTQRMGIKQKKDRIDRDISDPIYDHQLWNLLRFNGKGSFSFSIDIIAEK